MSVYLWETEQEINEYDTTQMRGCFLSFGMVGMPIYFSGASHGIGGNLQMGRLEIGNSFRLYVLISHGDTGRDVCIDGDERDNDMARGCFIFFPKNGNALFGFG